ncbi:UDP-glucose 4-epimerase GalE [Paracoccus tegillarcae]|uniref:UDP-glucose 4-epimerase n=1 Tax=Paracoccus tegillarcae TaxID=1529068 RepID=A0A2K9EEG7_9RHOB|nr:UDP-glucose 4-epimerase GalE [Paracoccus tegillarcae]AUH32709.1 UDP-glucose 4-epimerase GalE [Paracoccus tegillarcae]
MADAILVTGGAGYIGSHACKQLRAAGYLPVTFDNLSTGWRDAVKFGPLVEGDLLDPDALRRAFEEYAPVAVMHFAALSQVGEAMEQPGRYWRENVTGALNLAEAALAAGCNRLVFSSTCATYGDHDGVLLNESTQQQPLNAYGGSKLAIEQLLTDFGASDGLETVIFRYFNVAGADPQAEVGEFHRPETHLIPLVLDAACGRRDALTIYGTDYPTRDGTCMRDYVHVMDLVDAHVLGLDWLQAGRGNAVFCLGSGSGFTVREVMAKAAEVTGLDIPVQEGPRRGGDAVSLVSGSQQAVDVLGWQPQRSTLEQMIGDAWRWHQTDGYRG